MMFDKLRNFFSVFKVQQYPSLKQWGRFFKAPQRFLNRTEKIFSLVFSAAFLVSLIYLAGSLYFNLTKIEPANGGVYIEGLVGQPRFINPIYARISDVDQDLTKLVFSGLLKYDGEGKLVPDLAKSYEAKEGDKIYDVYLNEKLAWSDGVPLTANDVVFTIETIQNPDYKSPLILDWLGVSVEKISDTAVRFRLKSPYASFPENLTQGIIPQHIWKEVLAQNFPLSVYNLRPTGSGPYKLKDMREDDQGKITSLDLVRNPRYAGNSPYISQISVLFFDKEEELVKNAKKGKIKGFSLTDLGLLKNGELKGMNLHSFSLPRYFAIFFNSEKSKILADPNIRMALNYGTDKNQIVEKILAGYGKIVQSPVLPDLYGLADPVQNYQFDAGIAQKLLDKAGFSLQEGDEYRTKNADRQPAFQFKTDLREGMQGKDVENLQRCLAQDTAVYPEGDVSGYFGKSTKAAVIRFQEKYSQDILVPAGLKNGTGTVLKSTRDKLNELCYPQLKESTPLKISLTTVNQPVLLAVAELLKTQWKNLGVELEIKSFDVSELEKDVIKPRNYEGLLFGEVLSLIPDPYPFWHSSQIRDPGLNLALYQNKKVDTLLSDARQTLEEETRKEKLESFQNLLMADSPVVFLYNPDYLYFVSKDIKGINEKIIANPAKRFNNVESWYINTKRVLK